ncbi:MAG: tRNA uridine-5-carboxymethylaminomethyl(34) synthesis GTPase MnmE [Acidobacteriales bacterium]|nr:tRNA uridine-5-carboxymethylaminomethyl(34) synthesis GTPase MnmE [Terriglobales bacterium]
MTSEDTIVAIATPMGRGGIGVVRLSGAESLRIAEGMLRAARSLEANRAVFGELMDKDGERLDEVVATYFRAPHSYTRENVVEIAAHGSPVLLEHAVRLAIAAGARLAEPGEFTRRALMNGRINLTQAESVRDLIASQTMYQARVAAEQLGGALSKRVAPIKAKLLQLIARMEAGIDFADDDVDVLPSGEIGAGVQELKQALEALRSTYRVGRLVHSGVTLAIIGRPNVGKSSLFNRLVERERAIVTEIPGTTRDPISDTISLNGVPLTLVDTAGIREVTEADPVERIGIDRSREAAADADAIVLVFDASAGWTEEDQRILDGVEGREPILVGNKADLGVGGMRGHSLATSAVTGLGMEELRQRIWRRSAGHDGAEFEQGGLTSVRHESCVRASIESLERAEQGRHNDVPHEMLLIDLYAALRALDELTGETTPDDVLNLIFSSFCIGK